jgi:hypothetical protein
MVKGGCFYLKSREKARDARLFFYVESRKKAGDARYSRKIESRKKLEIQCW